MDKGSIGGHIRPYFRLVRLLSFSGSQTWSIMKLDMEDLCTKPQLQLEVENQTWCEFAIYGQCKQKCQQAERYATTCPQESFAVFAESLLPGLCPAKAPEWLSSTSNGTSKILTLQMTAGSKIICWANCRANVELTWGNSTKNVLVPFAWKNWFWDVWAAWEAARSQRILLWPSLAEATLRIPGNKPSCSRIYAHWGSTMLQANTCSLLATSNGAMEDFGSDNIQGLDCVNCWSRTSDIWSGLERLYLKNKFNTKPRFPWSASAGSSYSGVLTSLAATFWNIHAYSTYQPITVRGNVRYI